MSDKRYAIKKMHAEMRAILSEIKYKDWTLLFRLDEAHGEWENRRPYLQVIFYADDTATGEKNVEMKGRKWWLSPYMCRGEIVSTAFKAIEAVELHEMRENFLYRGKAIYGPHIDPLVLAEVADRLDFRR